MNSNTLGVYIHFPFCLNKCNYCSFFSVEKSSHIYSNYIEKIKSDLDEVQAIAKENGCVIDTLYIGGGTPSLIETRDVPDIVVPLKSNCKEITVEVNPCSTSREKFENFVLAGVNRISIGVQSMNCKILKYLGRKHSCEEAIKCIKEASQIFNNLSVDFIIGVDFYKRGLKQELENVLQFENVKHISLYGLSVEKGSAFYAKSIEPSEEQFLKDYEEASIILTQEYPFRHYEVSNFCKPGFESVHNMKYWLREQYIGIGPAAHSFFMGKRFCFECNFEDFFKYSLRDKFNQGEIVDIQQEKIEKIMLSLRLESGVKKELIGEEKKDITGLLIKLGYLKDNGDSVLATLKGRQVLNQVIKKLAF